MHGLHAERGPVVVLAALALLVQVLVVSLTLALSPSAMANGFGILCEPSSVTGAADQRATHDPANCACGPVCGHTGKITATGAAGHALQTARPAQLQAWIERGSHASGNRIHVLAAIRAPPSFLTV